MSATASIFHGLGVGLLIAVMRLFGWSWEANFFLVTVVAFLIPLGVLGCGTYKQLDKGPKPLILEDWSKITVAFVSLVVPSAIVGLVPGAAGHFDAQPSAPTVLAIVLIATVSSSLIFVSGLVDWFYVRPRLRGSHGSVCATSFAPAWRTLTRLWLLHRAAAVLGVIASATAIVALSANAWIKEVDTMVAGAVAGVATVIGGYYISRTAPLLAIAINPPVQVGDVIELAEEFNIRNPDRRREYFVVDVALEGVKLLEIDEQDIVRRNGRDAARTHDRTVDVADIAKLLRGRRPVHLPCDFYCQKLTEHCKCSTGHWERPGDETAIGRA
ncbi:MAG: hypothetical protein ITG02_15155 [Patulibacter sp.]|nr:hypothetical protein [Patulibacter sp.]